MVACTVDGGIKAFLVTRITASVPAAIENRK
jgi:hypothetical protein